MSTVVASVYKSSMSTTRGQIGHQENSQWNDQLMGFECQVSVKNATFKRKEAKYFHLVIMTICGPGYTFVTGTTTKAIQYLARC